MRSKPSLSLLVSTLKSKPHKAYLARIKERVLLNPGSEKETYHIVLDLSGSGIEYSVGDCVGVYPENDPHYVQSLVNALQDSSLADFLIREANLERIPKKLLGEHPDLLTLLSKQKIEPASLQERLLPLLPRFYSIASCKSYVGDEVHLTVALTQNSPTSYGVCSHYLCHRVPLLEPVVPIFHKASHQFSLPAESVNAPIIMIGPGTGVAPFRGFMQARTHPRNWLFFGGRNEKIDFYYRTFWEELASKNHLKLTTAFSRDQAEKIYVQHRLLENSSEIWRWLEEGAYLFVCGDASKMAKDVDKALLQIVETEGGVSQVEAKAYIKNLRANNRYQRDVY